MASDLSITSWKALKHNEQTCADRHANVQLQGSEAPLSTQTRQLPGSLESVWAARQATLPILAQSASAPHAPAALPEQAAGPGTSMPLSDQQALLRALLKSLSKHRRTGKSCTVHAYTVYHGTAGCSNPDLLRICSFANLAAHCCSCSVA